MKKIVIINGSPRMKRTYSVLIEIANLLENDNFEIEILNLRDYKIQGCRGCEVCILHGNCIIKDDYEKIIGKLREADGIILGTPVYLNNMSGLLKTFFDRSCVQYHRPQLYCKPILLVATTAGSGLNNTFKSIEEALAFGGDITGKVGRSMRNIDKKIDRKEIEDFVKHLKSNRRSYKTTQKQIINFQMQKVLAVKIIPRDKNFWEKQGWIEQGYFEEENVSKIKMIVGNSFYRLMSRVIKPVKDQDRDNIKKVDSL